nr:hypothetical protein [uncultured Mediterranean phage uvMED]
MAKYKSQATTKYYGIGGTGKVYTNTNSDGLAKSLINAGYKIGEGENKRIDRKKDKAIAKIDELYASGKSFETIQSEILANKHPDLTGKYIEQTTNYHAGKVKAAEVIKEIEANKNKYDYTDTSQSLETFYKEYMPEFESMDKATILGFSKTFNVYKSTEAVKDAENRSAWASEVKISEGVTLIETLPTDMIEAELGNTIKDMQTDVPNTNGSSKPNQLYTNKETLSVLIRASNKLIVEAKTEADLDRVDAILNADLGMGKDGTKLGSLGSRNHKEILKLKEDLEKKRRALIINDRQEKAEIEKEEVRALNASIFEEVEVEGTADGEVVTRPKNYKELMEIRDKLEAYGVPAYVTNFDRLMNDNEYIEQDPDVYNNLVSSIYDGEFTSQEEIADAINNLNIDPRLLAPTLALFESWSKSSTKNGSIHTQNTTYKEGLKYIENAVRGNYTSGGILKENGNKAIRNAHNYMKKELYDFEQRYLEENGKQPSTFEREEFMKKMGDIVIAKFVEGTGGDPTMKTMTEYETEIKEKEEKKKIKDEKYKKAGVSETTEAITQTLKDMEQEIPVLVTEALDKFDTSFLGLELISSDDRFGETNAESRQRFANEKIPAVVAEILKDVPITMDVIEAMETEDFNSLKEQIAKAIQAGSSTSLGKITTQQIDQALQLVIKNKGS